MSDPEPEGQPGLDLIAITDRPAFEHALRRLAQPISDYSFANVFIWNAALKLYWRRIHNHVCVFANGTGDLTLMLAPLPEPGATDADLRRCLDEAFEIMDAYNAARGLPQRSRIEYVSDEMLERISAVTGPSAITLAATPMSGDYIYPVTSMIDLAGGPLKSKRKARSKFMREHPAHRVETLTDQHNDACLALLDKWHRDADAAHDGQITEDESHTMTAVLRKREGLACKNALLHREALGMRGMVLYDGDTMLGFTLGEALSPVQASILFEKTAPDCDGAPQFIFSEFCRLYWADYPEINVGDDWGIPTLRFTKESYRPTRRLSKYVLARPVHAQPTAFTAAPMVQPVAVAATAAVRTAAPADAGDVARIEAASFDPADAFTTRQVRRLIDNPHALSLVAEVDHRVAGWCVALRRQHRQHRSGRIYSLAVAHEHRGRGIAEALLRQAFDTLRADDVRHVYLEVAADNAPAIALYHKLGFTRVRRMPDYYGPGAAGVSMRRAIEQPALVD